MTNLHKTLSGILLVLMLLVISSASSFAGEQSAPAINANMGVAGGAVDGDSSAVFLLSTSIPVPNGGYLQFDTLGSNQDDLDISGFGTRFFRRNPEFGLFGIKTSYLKAEPAEVYLIGLQGELYRGMSTLSWEAGRESGDIDHAFYTRLNARYYFTDNLSVELGVGHELDKTYGRANLEWQVTPIPNRFSSMALFIDASGRSHTEQILAGIRIYFGEPKSLIRRHREDSMDNTLKNSLAGIAWYNKHL